MSVGAVNKQTGDRIPTAGMPAIDDALDLTSVNPVQNAIITAALANKQDKTDNSLDTEAKTIVGAINEHEGDIDSLKSGLTDLSDHVDGDATTYPYADAITVEDAVPANLADCSVKVEPVQDLHGYDKPWVGGAGKNKLWCTREVGTKSHLGGTIITNADGTIELDGTFSENFTLIYNDSLTLPSGNYKLNGGITDCSMTITNVGSTYNTDEYAFTLNSDYSGSLTVYITARQYNHAIIKPMIRLSTETDATFAPYTNICPISGHTEASVQRDGKNLCDKGEGNVYNGGKLIPVSAGDKIYCYGEWVSDNKSFYGAIFSTPTETSKGNKIAILDDFYTGVSKEMTISTNGYFGVCFDTSVESYTVSKMMISKTPITSASDYVHYAGKTYTLALGDTIYGGTVDFDSGVMTVTHGIVDLGTLTWQKDTSAIHSRFVANKIGMKSNSTVIADCFQSGTYNEVYSHIKDEAISLHDIYSQFAIHSTYYEADYDATQFKTAMDGHYACYELATPFTVQLTPQQIQLLQGTNTLYASTGDISVTVNGVSGAIGAVQEQVNDHEERIGSLESVDLTTSVIAGEHVTIDATTAYVIKVGGIVVCMLSLTANQDLSINDEILITNMPKPSKVRIVHITYGSKQFQCAINTSGVFRFTYSDNTLQSGETAKMSFIYPL